METRPIKDRVADRHYNFTGVRLSDREIGMVEYAKEKRKLQSFSEAVRELMIAGFYAWFGNDEEADPDIIAYVKARQAKLATEFKAYCLTSISVEQERIDEIKKLCEWYWMNDRSDVGLRAIVDIIDKARENLKMPDISDDGRKSLDKVLVDLKEKYALKY